MPAISPLPTTRRRIAGLATAIAVAIGAGTAAHAASAAPSRARPTTLRVMTYNIQHGAGADEVFDLDRTAAAIRAEHPDVVALQEVDQHWADRSGFSDEPRQLARALRMRVFFGPIYDLAPQSLDAPDRRYGVAILAREPIIDAQDHQITRLSTQVPNASPVPAPGFAEIAIRVRGQLLHIYDTHLDYRADPSVRVSQVADTKAFIDNDPTPKILMGDLNANPASPELAPLLSDLTDVWSQLGAPHPPSYPSPHPTDAIDFVLVSSGITARHAAIIDTQASNHRPEVADLVLSRHRPRSSAG